MMKEDRGWKGTRRHERGKDPGRWGYEKRTDVSGAWKRGGKYLQ